MLFLVAALTLFVFPALGDLWSTYPSTDCNAGDMRSGCSTSGGPGPDSFSVTLGTCQSLCLSTGNCAGVVFYAPTGDCYLKCPTNWAYRPVTDGTVCSMMLGRLSAAQAALLPPSGAGGTPSSPAAAPLMMSSCSSSSSPCYSITSLSAAGASLSFQTVATSSLYTSSTRYYSVVQCGAGLSCGVVFTAFETESNYDFASVYAGAGTQGATLLRTSGRSLVLGTFSGACGGAVTVELVTDSSVNYAGLAFTVTAQACAASSSPSAPPLAPPQLMSSCSSSSSPCYSIASLSAAGASLSFQTVATSSLYATNKRYYSVVQCAAGLSCGVVFTTFETESNYDFASVYAGAGTQGSVLLQSSGQSLVSGTFSGACGGAVTVELVTDSSINYAGLSFTVSAQSCIPLPSAAVTASATADPSATISALATATRSRSALASPSPAAAPTSLGWSLMSSCSSSSLPCYSVKQLTTAGASLSFQTVATSSLYATNKLYYSVVQCGAGLSCSVVFTAFDTESGYDFASVYAGAGTDGAILLHTSGNLPVPGTFSGACGGAVTVELVTDSSISYAGLSYTVTARPCETATSSSASASPPPSRSVAASVSKTPSTARSPTPSPTHVSPSGSVAASRSVLPSPTYVNSISPSGSVAASRSVVATLSRSASVSAAVSPSPSLTPLPALLMPESVLLLLSLHRQGGGAATATLLRSPSLGILLRSCAASILAVAPADVSITTLEDAGEGAGGGHLIDVAPDNPMNAGAAAAAAAAFLAESPSRSLRSSGAQTARVRELQQPEAPDAASVSVTFALNVSSQTAQAAFGSQQSAGAVDRLGAKLPLLFSNAGGQRRYASCAAFSAAWAAAAAGSLGNGSNSVANASDSEPILSFVSLRGPLPPAGSPPVASQTGSASSVTSSPYFISAIALGGGLLMGSTLMVLRARSRAASAAPARGAPPRPAVVMLTAPPPQYAGGHPSLSGGGGGDAMVWSPPAAWRAPGLPAAAPRAIAVRTIHVQPAAPSAPGGECPICLGDFPTLVRLHGDHAACLEDIQTHARTALDAGQIPICCPIAGCGVRLHMDYFIRVLPPELQGRLENLELQALGIRLATCPFCACKAEVPAAGASAAPEASYSLNMRCASPACRQRFCASCQRSAHTGRCLTADQQAAEQRRQQEAAATAEERAERQRLQQQAERDEALVRANTRPCPRCQAPTERRTGCMHVTCPRKACAVAWNYCCGTMGHTGHPPFVCPAGKVVPRGDSDFLARQT